MNWRLSETKARSWFETMNDEQNNRCRKSATPKINVFTAEVQSEVNRLGAGYTTEVFTKVKLKISVKMVADAL